MATEQLSQAILHEAPIELSQGQTIRGRADLEHLVEPPALPACQALYDKNIRTVAASANSKDTEVAYVDIDYATLSEDNQRLALHIGRPIHYSKVNEVEVIDTPPDAIKLAAPLDATDTSESVAGKLIALTEQLQPQPLLWAQTYSLDELKGIYGYTAAEVASPEDFIGEGYYYDQGSQKFHLSEELFQKAQSVPETTS